MIKTTPHREDVQPIHVGILRPSPPLKRTIETFLARVTSTKQQSLPVYTDGHFTNLILHKWFWKSPRNGFCSPHSNPMKHASTIIFRHTLTQSYVGYPKLYRDSISGDKPPIYHYLGIINHQVVSPSYIGIMHHHQLQRESPRRAQSLQHLLPAAGIFQCKDGLDPGGTTCLHIGESLTLLHVMLWISLSTALSGILMYMV